MTGPHPPPDHLPYPQTAFIGRRTELRQVRTLLATSRMLTLVGPGGCGKSRLGLEVARGVAYRYPDGVRLVELAPIVDATLVLGSMAAALDVREQPGHDLMATVCAQLRTRHALIMIDNCEHVVEEVAAECDALLRMCAGLTVLATSRIAVNVPAERTFAVPGLSPRDSLRLLALRGADATRGFAVDAANEATAIEVCRRLDGMPLAIEIAAARLKTLSIQQLAERLSDRFQLLTGTNRAALPRQRTLQATMDWSYDLLPQPAQALWRRLSVFNGGATLESAERVCADEALDQRLVLDGLTNLVDNSVVQARDVASGRRFEMLETIREYGQLKVDTSGESYGVRRRHLEWMLGLASRAATEWRGRNQRTWLTTLDEEIDNVRAALEFAASDDRHLADGLRVASALWFLWHSRHISEGRRRLTMLLTSAPDGSARAYALNVAGFLAYVQGDTAAALPLLEESLRAHETLGEKAGADFALLRLGIALYYNNDLEVATAVLDQALLRYRAGHDRVGTYIAAYELSEACTMAGDYQRAHTLLRESHALKLEQGDTWHLGLSHFGAGLLAWREGDPVSAASRLRECLSLYQELDESWGVAKAVEVLGWVEASRENSAKAIQLLGASAAMHERLSVKLSPNYLLHHDRCVESLRAGSAPSAFESEWALGRAMTAAIAVDFASRDTARPTRRLVGDITSREQQIAGLVASGMTNREIAKRLSLAERTVDSHVEHIMNKLGHRSRAQIAAWVATHGAPA